MQHNHKESGNVLFLILIAVALFAALSYAVTQSTRSGGGSTTNETAGIKAAQLIQYPVGIRTAIMRMTIGGVDLNRVTFESPAQFGALSSTESAVFHPDGGGATYVEVSEEMLDPDWVHANKGQWSFNSNLEIANLGTSANSFPGNEYIAFLPGISDSLCARVNSDLGISGDIEGAISLADILYNKLSSTAFASSADPTLGDADTLGLNEQPYGCFQVTGVTNVFYYVLSEQ